MALDLVMAGLEESMLVFTILDLFSCHELRVESYGQVESAVIDYSACSDFTRIKFVCSRITE